MLLAALGLLALAVALLALRLAAGPIAITGVARHVAAPYGLSLGKATLGWQSRPAPALIITLRDPVLRQTGSVVAAAAEFGIGLPATALVRGQLRPLAIAATHGRIALHRGADGSIALANSAASGRRGDPAPWAGLRRLDLHDVTMIVTDDTIGPWQARIAEATANGIGTLAAAGRAEASLTLGSQTSTITAAIAGGTIAGSTIAGAILTASWTAIDAGRLRWARDYGAPDLPIAGSARIALGSTGQPVTAALALNLGAGSIPAAAGAIAIAGGAASLTADLAGQTAHLTSARLDLPTGSDGHAPVLGLRGTAHWSGGQIEAGLTADLDHLAFADLGRYWPAGAARDGRAWMLAHATAGTATAGHLDLTLAGQGRDITLTGITGRLRAEDLTLAWLAPVPPLIHASAAVTVQSPDALLVEIAHAEQAPSDPAEPKLRLNHSTLRITGLAQRVQTAAIEANLAGPAAQAIALLNEQRLHLLARHPVALPAPRGTLSARITLRLPLLAAVEIDRIAIRANGALADLHLGGIAAGRDLDDGAITLAASNDGLSLNGTARLAGLASKVSAALDFRAGGPSQALETYRVQGSASLAQLQAAGLPPIGLAQGTVGYDALVVQRRDHTAVLDVAADLGAAALTVATLGWSKAADGQGRASARILLDHGRLAGIEALSIIAPGIDVQGQAHAAAGEPLLLTLDPLHFGATRATGTLRLPGAADPVLRADVHGSVLDLAARLSDAPARPTLSRSQAQAAARKRRSTAAASRPAKGQAWAATLHFDRVLTGPGRSLDDVTGQAETDGLLMRRAQLAGQAGSGRFLLTLAPQGSGRRLAAEAQDAGGLMAALDFTNAVRGGTLSLQARFDDSQTDHPLAGTARIDRFRVVGAVALAKVLQAMTLYGVVDVLRGPGLGITHAEAPFRLADQVLTLSAARAYSSSLGFTVAGDVDLAAQRADLAGTVVPGYFFNTLPGKLPVLGKLFSPEKGGGVFAATYGLSGPLARPQVTLNPLAALAPGLLRELLQGKPAAP